MIHGKCSLKAVHSVRFLFVVAAISFTSGAFAENSSSSNETSSGIPRKLPAKKAAPSEAPRPAITKTATPAATVTLNGTSKNTKGNKKISRRALKNAPGTITLTYANPSWNKSSLDTDSAVILMRDKSTGRLAQLTLEESGPDTSIFSGVYSLGWDGKEETRPDFFIPPQDIFTDEVNGFKKLQAMIASNELKPKPLYSHINDQGEALIDVYDTADQVKAAVELEIKSKEVKEAKPAPAVKEQLAAAAAVLEAAQLAKAEAERKRLAEEASKREADRLRLLQLEKQKEEERLQKLKEMAESERRQRAQEAVKTSAEAMKFYNAGNFMEAERLFSKAIDLDPTNRSYYYAYGITLYRNEKFNESIVILQSVQDKNINPLEKEFYLGLNYYRLKEYSKAFQVFEKIQAANHPTLSPSAVFYRGLIEFDQLHYELAKAHFEKVLEISQDPKMDNNAESYIEKIERILYFARNKAKTFIFNLDLGLQYDSNVLLIADSTPSQSKPSQLGDIRYVAGFGTQWRPVYDKTTEFSLKARADTIYTKSSSLSAADPLSYSFSAPFTHKGTLFQKGWKMDIKPGYSMLYLDTAGTGTKVDYLNSVTADLSNMLIMSEEWFSSLNLKYQNDTGVTLSDVNANKITLNFNNMYLRTKKKNKGFISDFSFITNTAQGDAYTYTRFDLGLTYMAPFLMKESIFLAGLTGFSANYSKSGSLNSGTVRNDTNFALTLTVSKPILSWMNLSLMGNYTNNKSTIDTYSYGKYTLGMTLSSEFSL